MDGLKRNEQKRTEIRADEHLIEDEVAGHDETVVQMNQPIKERRSFLDKLTERVKDFLDNAE